MSKIILICRVSTESQSLDEQKAELTQYVLSKGYKEEDIIYEEAWGASAIKLDEKYQQMSDDVKQMIISNSNIKAVAVWEISRLGRRESILMGFKDFFVEHHIQLYCKNPEIQLFTETGELNLGMELAFSLFCTMAASEMRTKKERFARAKKANSEKGKMNGGHNCKYGYRVDEDNMEIPDPENAETIRMIYEMYATGKYSVQTLSQELNERGIVPNPHNGYDPMHKEGFEDDVDELKSFAPDTLRRILTDTAYIGYTDDNRNHSHRKYIPILSQELWDKVAAVRKKNYKNIPRGHKISIATKILKCPCCGNNMHNDNVHYVCWRHNPKSKTPIHCENDLTISQNIIDPLLYYQTDIIMHIEQARDQGKARDEAKAQQEIIRQKKATLQSKVDAYEEKKKKIIDMYVEALIDKEDRDIRLSKLSQDNTSLIDKLRNYDEQISKLDDIINAPAKKVLPFYFAPFITNIKELPIDEQKQINDLVHQHIKSATAERISYGIRDRRTTKPNAILFTIYSYLYGKTEYMYFPCKWKGHKLYKSINKTPMKNPIY